MYGEHALFEITCRDWFRRLISGELDLIDIECLGQPTKFEDEDSEAKSMKIAVRPLSNYLIH